MQHGRLARPSPPRLRPLRHAFDCSLAGDCWCAAEPYKMPVTSAEDCLCSDCLRRAVAALQNARVAPR